MGDVLLALSIPVLVFGGGIYAACDCWWRRRHPAPPSPYTHRAARLAEQDMLLLAEEIVDDAYAALGPLYDAPATSSAPGPDGPPAALSSRPSRPASTPDRAPSPPAAVQRP
ncbi:hypothetical protein WQO_14610 [Streptomyces globisporus C-1027]|uniref:Uncharacterized protein n=1 Tax=Streptomyces globisporus C-1027 TaxID=1172567 RepID=A0A0U3D1J5_STRGL|nr:MULTISPECIES: hypothetical protein [Streptomyces]ALU94468.1 hypothetical protein WQO_14610 [Streptomyces globisporus C-1027]OKJ24249.1 hypothetical protein AMK23_25685 [Streptomyces sp. CB02130]